MKYLGVDIDEQLRGNTHVEALAKKTTNLFAKFRRIAVFNWGLKFNTLHAIYKGVFLPIITYAASAWYDLVEDKGHQILNNAQKIALHAVTGAIWLASRESLCVVAGVPPIDLELEKRIALYRLRHGMNANIQNNVVVAFEDEETPNTSAKNELDRVLLNIWQDEWNNSERGRIAYRFLPNIEERLKSTWLKPSAAATRFITGYGQFNDCLYNRGKLVASPLCNECGVNETFEHVLLECKTFEMEREKVMNVYNKGRSLELFLKNHDSFKIFEEFCKKVLLLKWEEENKVVEVV